MMKKRCLSLLCLLAVLPMVVVGAGTALAADQAADAPPVLIPADKQLSPQWHESLYARGEKETFNKEESSFIAMPIGGIGAGQLYLCGDGTLGNWEIFNRYEYLGTGERNYMPRIPEKRLDQGFAVIVYNGEESTARCLNANEWDEVEFTGTYPIGRVTYRDDEFPLDVEMEAFSPFIPLNAEDSALPATVFNITVKNTSDAPVNMRSFGWLENGVCFRNAQDMFSAFRTQVKDGPGRTLLVHTAENVMGPTTGGSDRAPVVLADFEGEDYGSWTVAGDAFGEKPATGGLASWQHVSGFEGKGLVNTFLNGDASTGMLTSPPFKIERKYINFLIGGGHYPYLPGYPVMECISLLIDGKVVASSTGDNDNVLRWDSWDVSAYEGQEAVIQISDTRPFAISGYVLVDQVEMSDAKRRRPTVPFEQMEDYGSMALGFVGETDRWSKTKDVAATLAAPRNKEFQTIGKVYWFNEGRRNGALMTKILELAPGAEQTFTYVLGWHFANRKNGFQYATRFDDAPGVVNYVLDNYDRLAGETRTWRDTYYDSTLPYWLLDRLHSTVSTLATGTCQWWENGRFWAWEGVISCPGTCTHVWNYAHAHARLFPQLARSVREMQDFNPEAGFVADTGMVGFRGESDKNYAADGQCGTVLKAYREHLMSADDAFLKRNWPSIKKALEFSIAEDGKGSPVDGLIEATQHNTYDIHFEGPNTFVGSLYLAALRAGEEMARLMGDTEFADKARTIFESGQKLTVERLWDGEYFIQDVDLEKHPANQYGPGCASDQLFGETWAHEVGLGHLYPVENVKSALQSIWKYNWTPDISDYVSAHPALRNFAAPGEAGLFVMTWPKSDYMEASIFYKNEVWTGIEYQVATNMIQEGLTDEGLSICRGIHERYAAPKRNPYNEVECGDHYARGMASWGVFTALAGFEYDGPAGRIGFAPKVTQDNYKTAFTGAEGWGTFEQKRDGATQTGSVAVKWGKLTLKSLALAAPEKINAVTVKMGDKPVAATHAIENGKVVITLTDGVTLKKDEALEVSISG